MNLKINDMYIEDDLHSLHGDNSSLEPLQINENVNFDPNNDTDLNPYLVSPDGIYLQNQGQSDSDNDMIQGLDPEPSLGPVDPG